ncbi:mannan endo-1,6-alpha-mannosidase DCW1 [Colletotrichum spaethianum]|uniref:Mannan endo-1,6-alpha-mannosidase DCW1 n=1 Tax=Colletotrichum spaethianum TaxID=700344 RepID=A0AA37P4Q2_9PEZI|nr:mannan endo-1,6-alpha-mannosidase DCW1 [Colletotrichum spaethianum]GKT41781.1 mannan endo-1,6-alpha-mannosidase DCW1 [Colletotrichum spaethianum]
MARTSFHFPEACLLVLALASCATSLVATTPPNAPKTFCPIFYPEAQPPTDCEPKQPTTFLAAPRAARKSSADITKTKDEPLEAAFEALTVMQHDFFIPDQGTWPEAIDWTAAVMETMLSGTLTSLSQALAVLDIGGHSDKGAKRNLIDTFFTQLVASYFGQDDVAIRHQAFDDILWVVLGWIDALKFIDIHSELFYPREGLNESATPGLGDALANGPWHGQYWIPSFAHRARIFWDLGSKGWDTRLCGGGMNWNPRLEPYKNAITNELWIAASISMYLWFPGDNNTTPWINSASGVKATREPKYLAAAIEGYKWITEVNMTNNAGLYVDGFHVDRSKQDNTKCDLRSEAVFTYNQGVLLTGQRGLFTATGSASYLEDGHKLIQAVIKASGWDLKLDQPVDDLSDLPPGYLPPWRGLGRGGILEESCDASATCSQDGQTFKGIFFHHFVTFCQPIDPAIVEPGMTVNAQAYDQIKTAHASACQAYLSWVQHNAQSALLTRDREGRFGTWWGAGVFQNALPTLETDGIPHNAPNVTDYRNYGLPHDGIWANGNPDTVWAPNGEARKNRTRSYVLVGGQEQSGQQVLGGLSTQGPREEDGDGDGFERRAQTAPTAASGDPNDRGRGRTPETQNGGMALMRAWWELVVASNGTYAQQLQQPARRR